MTELRRTKWGHKALHFSEVSHLARPLILRPLTTASTVFPDNLARGEKGPYVELKKLRILKIQKPKKRQHKARWTLSIICL